MRPLFITLHQTIGDVAYINAREIRGVFPGVNRGHGFGAVLNIGTPGAIPVTESVAEVLALIDEAFAA